MYIRSKHQTSIVYFNEIFVSYLFEMLYWTVLQMDPTIYGRNIGTFQGREYYCYISWLHLVVNPSWVDMVNSNQINQIITLLAVDCIWSIAVYSYTRCCNLYILWIKISFIWVVVNTNKTFSHAIYKRTTQNHKKTKKIKTMCIYFKIHCAIHKMAKQWPS